jgi:hypothetical protein
MSERFRRLPSGLITGLVIVLLAVVIILAQVLSNGRPQPTEQQMTLEPQIITNLTQLPVATPLSGEAAHQVNQLRTLITGCPDYTPERRSQMEQHIEWLLHPAQIPGDITIALGSNPTGKLIFGMATYTSIQWSLEDRPTDSCLLPIGNMLNEMLVAAGEEPFDVFNNPQEP